MVYQQNTSQVNDFTLKIILVEKSRKNLLMNTYKNYPNFVIE